MSIALSTFLSVSPSTVTRAQRLESAIAMLRQGVPEKDVRKRIQTSYQCSVATAWRTVEMARDIV